MVKFWSRNKKSNKPYQWDTSKGGSGISPTDVSSKPSTIEKTKAYLDEKEREKLMKQMMANRKTEIGKDVILGQPFRGGSSGAPINFVKAQEDASKVRTEIREGAMPMDTSKKVQKMTESASGKTDQFLGGVYTPNVDKVWDANKQKWVDRSLLEKVMEETQSSKTGSPIEEKKPEEKKPEEKKPEEKKKSEPYVSYGISNPDRPKTWLEKFRIANKVQLKPTFIEESGKKKYGFSFMNRKTKQQEETIVPDSVTIGKHIKVYDNNGKPVKTKSGKGTMEYGVGRPITNQSILKIREELAELTDKAGLEPIDWDLRDESGNMLNTNQVGLLRLWLLNEAGLI